VTKELFYSYIYIFGTDATASGSNTFTAPTTSGTYNINGTFWLDLNNRSGYIFGCSYPGSGTETYTVIDATPPTVSATGASSAWFNYQRTASRFGGGHRRFGSGRSQVQLGKQRDERRLQ